MSKKYIAEVVENKDGDCVLQFSEQFCKDEDWREGDSVQWNDNNGEVSLVNLTKKNREGDQIFLVETISMFKIRYAVRAKNGEHACDAVTMNEVAEFSQKHLDEVVASYRPINEEEFIDMVHEESEYMHDWSRQMKLNLIHKIKY